MSNPDSTFRDALHLASILRERVLAEKCVQSLREFTRASWAQVAPGVPYSHNWHIDCLIEHLEALAKRQILRLIINIPPRSLKSTLISVIFPSWQWLGHPEEKFLSASYSRPLSIRDSRRTRNLIMSPWYQQRWKDVYSLSNDQNEKGRFDNDKGGFRLAASVEGGVIGEGGSFTIYDDPNDLDKMQFEDYRQGVKDWYSGVASSRFINPMTDVRLCVQQRSSYGDDLTSYLLELGGWEHLVIPNEFEGDRKVSSIGWSDPRTHIGELMHPARLGPDETARLKVEQRDNYCTPGYTPILMSDFSEKKIENIQVGDEIVGYERGGVYGAGQHKAFLKKATVTAISRSVQMVYRYRTASGREVHCTANHKWYRTNKSGIKGNRALYLPLKLRSRLHSVYKPVPGITSEEQRMYDWLGGILDGEGSCVARNLVAISQSSRNADIQAEIEQVLSRLGFSFGVWRGSRSTEERKTKTHHRNPKWAQAGVYNIHGGRTTKIHLLAHARMVKRQRFVDNLWASSKRLTESNRKQSDSGNHKVISIEPLGEMAVYGLTTTTGNYVAWGFASQNSGQYQQRPASLSGGRLKKEWFNFYNPPGTTKTDESGRALPVRLKSGSESIEKLPRVLPEAFEQVVQSWDMAFKDEEQNSRVAGHAWGRVGSNVYLLSRDTRHRNFPETLAAVRKMSIEFPCPEKLVEGKANGPAVIQTMQNEIPGLIEVEPYGTKFSRVSAISGYVEAGNVFLPNPDLFPWVWELLDEFSSAPKDDTDAMTQALKRLFDSAAHQGVPEFRVQPRIGEPSTAVHVMSTREAVPVEWRRFAVVVPGAAVLWLAEAPSGSLRVLREMSLDKLDALEAGRRISEGSLGEVRERLRSGVVGAYELWLPKEAFAPVEPIGSYAELLEQGVLSFVSLSSDWDLREESKLAVRNARFRVDLVEEEDAALDRLRALLAFAPPGFERVPYNRAKAMSLREDLEAYADYMAAVEGEVRGEWPKIKISSSCKELISQMGGFRRDKLDEVPSFIRALLMSVCVPSGAKPRGVIIAPINQPRPGRGNLLAKKFAMGRR